MASKKVKRAAASAGAPKKATTKKPVIRKKTALKAKSAPKKKPVTPKKTGVRKSSFSLAAVRENLLRELLKLEKRLGTIRHDDSTSEATNVGDLADAASHIETREILRGIQITEAEQLSQIESALERLEGGSYGACVRCGGPIEAARLEALPHAPTCINCRRREERGEFKGR